MEDGNCTQMQARPAPTSEQLCHIPILCGRCSGSGTDSDSARMQAGPAPTSEQLCHIPTLCGRCSGSGADSDSAHMQAGPAPTCEQLCHMSPLFGLCTVSKTGFSQRKKRDRSLSFKAVHFSSAVDSLGQRDLVRILKVSAHRQAVRNARDQNAHGL